MKSQEKI